MLRVWLVGLFAMLTVYYMVLRASWRHRLQLILSLVDGKLLIALVAGQLLFFIPYPAHYSQLIALGLSLVLLGQYRREAVTAAITKKG